MHEIKENVPDTITPSQFVYLMRNDLRDKFVRKINHTPGIVRTSQILAYTQALDDVIKLLDTKDREMEAKRANT